MRYIGIDTPEMNFKNSRTPDCFASEASAKNKELVLGKEVTLVRDVNNTDKYGRLLRYVYVGNDFVNEVLVKEGYANARSYKPDIAKQDILRNAERYAKENKIGLWNDNACN